MSRRDSLTREKLAKKFPSTFELVNYTISQVQKMVRSGRPPRVYAEVPNPAVIVVEEILQGKDMLEDLSQDIKPLDTPSLLQKEVMAAEQEEMQRQESRKESRREEKKKMRRLTEKM